MMPRGDLRVKFASFGKLPRMKKPIDRIISDWLGCGAACPKPANSLFAVAVHWSRCVFLNPSVYPFSKACFRASSPPGGGGFWSLPPDSWYSKYF